MPLHRLTAACSLLFVVACASSSPPGAAPSAVGAGGAAPPASGPPAASAAPSGSAYAAVQGSGTQAREIAPGASCEGHGRSIAGAEKLAKRSGGDLTLAQQTWGCGCPTRPVFALVYEPGSSPLSVHLCADGAADRCRALCEGDVTWDLTELLRAEGETDVVVR